ncbi:RecA recombinase Rhp51 [Bonamia ostreae]|uniref:RecA recombinase Rhp51 n=1 Tax=Bonamia ostreae TaxID=126728 RepID=A0ABV2AU42_9EUKA
MEEKSKNVEINSTGTPIDSLEGVSGISSADVKKLKDGGYYTVESIAFETKRALVAIKGITEQKADKLTIEGFYENKDVFVVLSL